MTWGSDTRSFRSGVPHRLNDEALRLDEVNWRHFRDTHRQEGLASDCRGQNDRSMQLEEADERSDRTEQQTHSMEVGLARNSAVGSYGKVLEDNPDAAVVKPAHFENQEDKRTVDDHPDQPGLEVGHALRTASVAVAHFDPDRPDQ